MLATLATLVLLQTPNVLSPSEKRAGWKLIFDGQTTKGWHNFKTTGVGSGWVIKNGVLTCADAKNAGDIVTDEQFEWFEMKLDFNVNPGENSGVMFHVTEEGEATWHSGPEIQIYDHEVSAGVETTGFLYQLYQPKKGVNAVKPAGKWNTMRLMITKKKCWTEINGVKYYDFVLGSDDFLARLAKSKFAEMPYFAKKQKGSIAIQGDHGIVSFRNMKIRPIRS